MSTASFYRWRRLLSEPADRADTVPTLSPAPAFLELGGVGGGSRPWDLELDLGGGVKLWLRR